VGGGANPCWRRSLISLGLGLFLIGFGAAVVVRGVWFLVEELRVCMTDPLLSSSFGGELVIGVCTHIRLDELDYSFGCESPYSLYELLSDE
jgi:hypothetical protein